MKTAFIYFFFLIFSFQALAQPPRLRVAISQDIFKKGDTLLLQANFSKEGVQMPDALFAVTLENEHEDIWQMRYPLKDGNAEAALIIGDSLPEGKYNLLFAILPVTLEFSGQVMYPNSGETIVWAFEGFPSGIIMPVRVEAKGFNLKPLDFTGSAMVRWDHGQNHDLTAFPEFSSSGKARTKRRDHFIPPMVAMNAWLDSAYAPVAYALKPIIITKNPESEKSPGNLDKEEFFQGNFLYFDPRYPVMKKVKQYADFTGLRLYDSLYPSLLKIDSLVGHFNLIDSLPENPELPLMEFLQGRLGKIELKEVEIKHLNRVGFYDGYERVLSIKNTPYRLYTPYGWGQTDFLAYPLSQFADILVGFQFSPASNAQGVQRSHVVLLREKKYPFVSGPFVRNRFMVNGYTPFIGVINATGSLDK